MIKVLPKILLNLAFQEPFGRSPRAALAWPGERDEFLVVWLFVGFFFSVCVLLFFLGVFFFLNCLVQKKKKKKKNQSGIVISILARPRACVRACEGGMRARPGRCGALRGAGGA